MSGKAFAALLPLGFAIRKVPLPAIATASVLAFQTAAALNGVFEAAMTELLTDSSVPMRIVLALAVTPGWVAALTHRNMAPEALKRASTTPLTRAGTTALTSVPRVTAPEETGAEAHGMIETAVEDVSHWLVELAVEARRLPPGYWMAFTASGAITLQAVSNAAAGYLSA